MNDGKTVSPESLDVLYMLYDDVSVVSKYGFDIYECRNKNDSKSENCYTVFHSKKHNLILQYERVFSYIPLGELLIVYMQSRDGSLLHLVRFIDMDTHKEVGNFSDVSGIGNIGNDLLTIKCETKTLVYSIHDRKVVTEALVIVNIQGGILAIGCTDKITVINIKKPEVVSEYRCTCCIPDKEYTAGAKYSFINFGTSGLIIDNKTSEIVSIIKNNIYNMKAESCRTSYCDIIIFAGSGNKSGLDKYLDEDNYFICGKKIMRTKEFLDFLTIKEIKPAYKEGTTRVIHYDVETYKGLKGKLSTDFRKLSLNDVLKEQNILDIRFGFLRKKYLL